MKPPPPLLSSPQPETNMTAMKSGQLREERERQNILLTLLMPLLSFGGFAAVVVVSVSRHASCVIHSRC